MFKVGLHGLHNLWLVFTYLIEYQIIVL